MYMCVYNVTTTGSAGSHINKSRGIHISMGTLHDPYPNDGDPCQLSRSLSATVVRGVHHNPCTRSRAIATVSLHAECAARKTFLQAQTRRSLCVKPVCKGGMGRRGGGVVELSRHPAFLGVCIATRMFVFSDQRWLARQRVRL